MVTQNKVGGQECMQRWGAERALPYSCVTIPGPGQKHLLLMCITSISDKLGTALPSPLPQELPRHWFSPASLSALPCGHLRGQQQCAALTP